METYFNELKSSRIPVAFLFKFFQATLHYETGRISAMTQRGFTNKLKRHLPAGWQYAPRGWYVGDYWKHDDLETLKSYSSAVCSEYVYVKRERNEQQPLIYKV